MNKELLKLIKQEWKTEKFILVGRLDESEGLSHVAWGVSLLEGLGLLELAKEKLIRTAKEEK